MIRQKSFKYIFTSNILNKVYYFTIIFKYNSTKCYSIKFYNNFIIMLKKYFIKNA